MYIYTCDSPLSYSGTRSAVARTEASTPGPVRAFAAALRHLLG